jgi:hypothetical protein
MKLFNINSAILLSFFLTSVHADMTKQLVGNWCFYEQTAIGNTVSEKVDIAFNKDLTYVWKEGIFEQKGTWKIDETKLVMGNIGTHEIVSVNDSEMELKRMSIMKFKKSECDAKSFSDQDITRFHNAASTGEDEVLSDYIARGIDINIADWNRGDTALIKASKFCKISIAKILINNGADKGIKNERGKKALDFAKSSSFHSGCSELVNLLN